MPAIVTGTVSAQKQENYWHDGPKGKYGILQKIFQNIEFYRTTCKCKILKDYRMHWIPCMTTEYWYAGWKAVSSLCLIKRPVNLNHKRLVCSLEAQTSNC